MLKAVRARGTSTENGTLAERGLEFSLDVFFGLTPDDQDHSLLRSSELRHIHRDGPTFQ